MVSSKLKELKAARARLASLEKSLAAELATLPEKYGFASAAEFVAAVTKASGVKAARKPGRAKAVAPAAPRKRRKRAVITDETRAEVKKLVEAGKTGKEISTALGISVPSVQNIKKALGLVGKR
jgi:hypothetical protein